MDLYHYFTVNQYLGRASWELCRIQLETQWAERTQVLVEGNRLKDKETAVSGVGDVSYGEKAGRGLKV